MSTRVKCGYCGQWAKSKSCDYFQGSLMHHKPNCNCFQIATNKFGGR